MVNLWSPMFVLTLNALREVAYYNNNNNSTLFDVDVVGRAVGCGNWLNYTIAAVEKGKYWF